MGPADLSIVLAQVAEGRYEDALGVEVSATRAQINRAHIRRLHEFKDSPRCREALNRAKGVVVAEAPAVKAKRLLDTHRGDLALAFLESLPEDRLDIEVQHIMGCILLRLGRNTEAVRRLEIAVRGRGSPSDYLWLGNAYEGADRLDEALRCYELAVQSRGDADACLQLGNMLVRLERFDEALPHFDRAASLGLMDRDLEEKRRSIMKRRKRTALRARTSRVLSTVGLTGDNWPRLILLVAVGGLVTCCLAFLVS